MAFLKFFHRSIRKHYPAQAEILIEQLKIHYSVLKQEVAFSKSSTNPVDRRLDFTACFLALVLLLENKGESFIQIREICLEITKEYIRPKNKLQAWMKRQPARIIDTLPGRVIIRFMQKKTQALGHPDGFLVKVITDPAETFGLGYGIDILECGICKQFQKHGMQRYATILCEVDELTSSLAGLEIIRSNTIANGAKKCDFRWKRL
ncbi:MAG: L-2-amino-thiazoline-4-carboxylic acid hydrolase [Saprospiraceae bacterium]|nr:L-2-amino-thiazoline-4-carboxylic acid hydrolase [Saprospiraceae bacterium]MCB9343561.1 L-2-amino-thiazoline-4-carboxylic acid hydrolase [Lewinellaceae bacterium]